jgi:hypothetical protein
VSESPLQTVISIKDRFNSSSMLSLILKSLDGVKIPRESFDMLIKYDEIRENVKYWPYEDGYMDYIKSTGGYVQVEYYENKNDEITMKIVSKEEGERNMQDDGVFGYVCIRSKWSDRND